MRLRRRVGTRDEDHPSEGKQPPSRGRVIRPGGIAEFVCLTQYVFAPCDTTEQFNAHNTDTRKVCYSWHPWYGHTVTVRASVVRRDRAIFRCQLEPDAFVKSLEIPQWMFDPVLCAAMCQQEMPVVNGKALLQLKALLA